MRQKRRLGVPGSWPLQVLAPCNKKEKVSSIYKSSPFNKRRKVNRTWGRLCSHLSLPQISRRFLSAHLRRPLLRRLLLLLLLLLRLLLRLLQRRASLRLLRRAVRPRNHPLHVSFKGPLSDFALLVAPVVLGPARRPRIACWRRSLL